MRLEGKDLNPGVWFDIPNDPESARVRLRVLDMDANKQIRSQTVAKGVVYKQLGRRQQVHRIEFDEIKDEDKRGELLWDFCIVDWENIFWDDKLLPCNTENKLKLMNKSVEFATFIANCIEKLAEYEENQVKEAEKNSSPSQRGASPKNRVTTAKTDTD